jgi:hypothetical protein
MVLGSFNSRFCLLHPRALPGLISTAMPGTLFYSVPIARYSWAGGTPWNCRLSSESKFFKRTSRVGDSASDYFRNHCVVSSFYDPTLGNAVQTTFDIAYHHGSLNFASNDCQAASSGGFTFRCRGWNNHKLFTENTQHGLPGPDF